MWRHVVDTPDHSFANERTSKFCGFLLLVLMQKFELVVPWRLENRTSYATNTPRNNTDAKSTPEQSELH